MKSTNKNPLIVPISSVLGASLIVVFLLYTFQIIKQLPCGNKPHHVFMSSFVHIDPAHLMSNLYALYAISRVEQEMGWQPFVWLLIFLMCFNTLAEFFVRKLIPSLNCSIGFSGILFGLITWEIASRHTVNMDMILAIVLMVATPSTKSANVSLSGHAIGAVSGIFGGVLWQMIHKKKNTSTKLP